MHGETVLKVRKVDVFYFYTPLLSVLVHESREHLVVEAFHTFATDAEVFSINGVIVFQRHHFDSKVFSNQVA